jgi:GNAT superfamily N-acetyltransferase
MVTGKGSAAQSLQAMKKGIVIMKKINDLDRNNLKGLCSCRKDDSMLLWFLDGNPYCDAWVNNELEPDEAVIIAADFCYLLGEVKYPDEIVPILIENAQYKVIIPCGSQWITFLNAYLAERVRCYKRYAIKQEPDVFDKDHLKQLVEGIDSRYEIKRIDEALYNEVLGMDWAADGCYFFRSYLDFEANGLGYIVCKDGQVVCIASSYTAYKNRIGVTIGTLEEHRRKGLASACAARLILACLERGIYPAWEAANMKSVALAEKLGYHFDKEFDVYSIV